VTNSMCETGDEVTRFWLGEEYVVFTKGRFGDVSERCEDMRDLECVCFWICVVEVIPDNFAKKYHARNDLNRVSSSLIL
jgi:hypothetical protein